MKNTAIQHQQWHTWAGIKWTGKQHYWLEKGVDVGDNRAEGSWEIGDWQANGQAIILLMPEIDGTHAHIFDISQLDGSYIGDLFY